MVLLQSSIVVITIKSVYLIKKWEAAPSKKGAFLIIIITNGYARFVGLRAMVRRIRIVGPKHRVRGIWTRRARAHGW
jgi:hypothetical protein